MRLHYAAQFKRDYKKMQKQKKEIAKLRAVIEKLMHGETLETKYRDHQLSGNWKGHRDCHLEPDWILIYRIAGDDLFLERTGSHSDLFKEITLCYFLAKTFFTPKELNSKNNNRLLLGWLLLENSLLP